MKQLVCFFTFLMLFYPFAGHSESSSWPVGLPVYDHIVIVVEENKDYSEIIGSTSPARYINDVLKKEGANFTQMYGEEHYSQGNYFWLFSGFDQNVGFVDQVPVNPINAANLGQQLIDKGFSFKGYAETLPSIGYTGDKAGSYARKHVPWISFANVPNGTTAATSSNLRFADFPTDYTKLPTVAFVIPNLDNDMHNGPIEKSIPKGDAWLMENLDAYYQWAKKNNSLLILTFDENNDKAGYQGLTNPGVNPASSYCQGNAASREFCTDLQNHTVTIFAGAHIKQGDYPEGKGITHVNILRTLEAMYGLAKAGAQQQNAAGYGITDGYITDVFDTQAGKH